MSKFISMEEAVAKVESGMTIMMGGFLGVGSPNSLVEALLKTDVKDLTVITNDTAFAHIGVGKLIAEHRVVRIITSHIGTNTATGELYHAGELEIEFVPQGTLIERIRCAGAGLGGILTPTGLGTVVEEGKQVIHSDGKDYLLEKPLRAQIALLGASTSDEEGNLYSSGERVTQFQFHDGHGCRYGHSGSENIVKTGEIQPELVHTQGIFVDYVIKA